MKSVFKTMIKAFYNYCAYASNNRERDSKQNTVETPSSWNIMVAHKAITPHIKVITKLSQGLFLSGR